jgi:xanthine/uracil/vitamin C permease (AzgA family)
MTDKTPQPAGRERTVLLGLLSEIRVIIGGLFLLYGVIVSIAGFLDSQPEIDKAQGVNINLWTGLAMLVFGVIFLVWAYLRPARRSEDRS